MTSGAMIFAKGMRFALSIWLCHGGVAMAETAGPAAGRGARVRRLQSGVRSVPSRADAVAVARPTEVVTSPVPASK